MNLTYTVELKDWNNIDSYPTLYTGSSLLIAMSHFKEQHLKGQDVILFIEDEARNTIDTLENYGQVDNIIKCKELFPQEDKELIKQTKEAVNQKEIYNNQYKEQLNTNEELKKNIERLQFELKQLRQETNKKASETIKKESGNLYWYEYKLRGFSPFCQPKGHIQHDESKGRWGIIAYNRELTKEELYEYDLIPFKVA